jgi:hypothetical protein
LFVCYFHWMNSVSGRKYRFGAFGMCVMRVCLRVFICMCYWVSVFVDKWVLKFVDCYSNGLFFLL